MPFQILRTARFDVEFHSHSLAILTHDFPQAIGELTEALSTLTIPIEEIIAGGGGEAKGTQRLRRSLSATHWVKTCFEIRKTIKTGDEPDQTRQTEAISHEIDHVRAFPNGSIALEIEWNNKDPFFDRDLENFKRLHLDGAISVGVIVTRGTDLQDSLEALVTRFVEEHRIRSFDDLKEWGYEPTAKQRTAISRRISRKRNPLNFERAFMEKFISDKYGAATTHWSKLEDRVRRGVGNPCPLLLIGLPSTIVTFGEGKAALEEVLRAELEEEKI